MFPFLGGIMIKEAIYLNQLKKYERRLNRNQIEIAHFIPGRIRLKSEIWKHNKRFLQKVTDCNRNRALCA